jgi:hypothetical protein
VSVVIVLFTRNIKDDLRPQQRERCLRVSKSITYERCIEQFHPNPLPTFQRKVPMSLSSPRRRGAPLGNSNALKLDFSSRRKKKSHLSTNDSTDLKSLLDQIALIHVFTRRLAESCNPAANLNELVDTLRILCLASSTISRILRVNYLISGGETDLDREIEEAIRHVSAELDGKSTPLPPLSKGSDQEPFPDPIPSGEPN